MFDTVQKAIEDATTRGVGGGGKQTCANVTSRAAYRYQNKQKTKDYTNYSSSSSSSNSNPSKLTLEKSKSNRSTCKQCLNTIAKESMRLGCSVFHKEKKPMPYTSWFHSNCLSFDRVPQDMEKNEQRLCEHCQKPVVRKRTKKKKKKNKALLIVGTTNASNASFKSFQIFSNPFKSSGSGVHQFVSC